MKFSKEFKFDLNSSNDFNEHEPKHKHKKVELVG